MFQSKVDVCLVCYQTDKHKHWCRVVNPTVKYAFDAARDEAALSVADRLHLHAMGVAWVDIKFLR